MIGIDRLREVATRVEDGGCVWPDGECLREGGVTCRSCLADKLYGIAEQMEAEQDAETVRSDAMRALEWVREHGSVDELTRMFQDADNRRVELCGALGIDLDKGWSEAMAAMRLRLMPEGCIWPHFDDGEPVKFGEEAIGFVRKPSFVVDHVTIFAGGEATVCSEVDHGSGKVENFVRVYPRDRVKRPAPKVLDADGGGDSRGEDARERVTAARAELSVAMRALSRPEPDGEAAVRSLRACADMCDRLLVTIVNDRIGGMAWN